MKKTFLLAAFAATLPALHFMAGEAAAQHGAVPEVAIIDLTYIFANHTRFKLMTEDMRRDVEAAEAQLQASKESLKKLSESLEDFRRGTDEYKALEEELAKRTADLQLQVNIQKKDFLEQEARNYYAVYQEILQHVKYYADEQGIALVLRFNGDPVDEADPRGVLNQLNKIVVYYNRVIDITPIILEQLNSKRPAPQQALPAQTNRPRQGVPGRR